MIRQVPISLGKLAERFGCELIGDPDVVIDDVGSLRSAGPRSLSFLTGSKFKEQLISTEAAAVVQGNFIVVAISAEIGTYVFQRSYDQSGWTEWTSASLTDVPLMSDITALGGALFSVTGDGIWQWGQYRVPDSDVDQQALDGR